jgi:sterol desaturase/sphingolipid hydroxylase (fatty acid hydroxylase superfamily)
MSLAYTQECLDAADHKWPAHTDDPAFKGQKRPKRIRIFKNTFVENVLAKSHWVLPIVWFGPFIAYGLWRGFARETGVLGTLGLYAVGWLAWTLLEYILHRWLFHHQFAKNLDSFLVHGYHHEFPEDPYRLVAPPMMSWPLAAVILSILLLTVGPRFAWTLFAGTASGYIAYDWIHYYTHHARPKYWLGKWLRKYHMLHHHKTWNKGYGVSSPLWDFVFGTFQKSSTTTTK